MRARLRVPTEASVYIEVAKDYFNFASAHFLIFANGRREPLHGHNYQVSVAIEGELDRAGVVLDFITFKPLVKQICDALDHRTLIQTNSSAIKVRKNAQQVAILYKKQKLILPGETSSFCRLPTPARSCWPNTLLDSLNARCGKISQPQSDIWRSRLRKLAVKEGSFATTSSAQRG